MDKNSLDEMIFLGALLNEEFPRAEHPLKKEDCPSIPEFEQLAADTAGWSLKRWMHTSNCPYCQLTVKLFREEMGIKPWWEQWEERAREVFVYLRGMQLQSGHAAPLSEEMRTSLPALCAVPALVIHPDQKRSDAEMEIMAADNTIDECLMLRVRMKEPFFNASHMPVELTLVAHQEGEPLGALLLPNLILNTEERLKVQLPAKWRESVKKRIEAWEKMEAKKEFPLRFILRPNAG
jgi:hypothetical protein